MQGQSQSQTQNQENNNIENIEEDSDYSQDSYYVDYLRAKLQACEINLTNYRLINQLTQCHKELSKHDYECPICLDKIKSDHYFPNCGHLFHFTCISRVKDSKCPICRERFYVRFVDW